jgi:serine/threonine-protein kinase
VHRDVKPDNVILQDGDPGRACLLDFGLSYHKAADPDSRTEDGQEVGNRFLRLPELSAGGVLKQAPRSDLSFAGGILFFLIVGSHPDVLQDAERRLPHQRRPALAALQTAAGPRLARLVAFFDNAFDPVLAARFSNAGAMLGALDRLMEAPTAIRSPDDDLAAIRGVIDTAAERRRIASIKTFGDTIEHFGPVFQAIRDELGAGFLLG